MSHLEVVLDIDANTLGFGGSIQTDVGLRDLLEGVPGDAAALMAWVPDVGVEAAGFAFDPAPAGEGFTLYVVAGVPGSASTSATLFVATLPTPLVPPAGGDTSSTGTTGTGTTGTTSTTAYVVGFGLTSSIDLSGTPLFGSMLSGISLQDLGIQYASAALPADAFTLPPPAPRNQPAFPAGLVLTLTIAGGGAERTFTLSPSTGRPPNAPPAPRALPAAPPGGDVPEPQPAIQWFPVQATVGPLTIGRVGILTTDSQFGLGLDASVSTTAFSVVLTGFTVTFPVDRIDLSAVHVQLDGLSLSFTSPSVAIGGSLVRREHAAQPPVPAYTEYAGSVLIQVGRFGIAAVGSYANLDGCVSLFVYGMVEGAFGGPPAFFVTGLAAGFGYNRSLRLPPYDAVAQHPFLQAARDGADAAQALALLTTGGWVPPSPGDYWLAAGVQFTSFEIVRSFVLVSVQFGDDLVFALLGISSIRLPQVGPTYAYAELAVDAVLRPRAGTFQLTAMLTPNSFLLDPACHLQGGFAFWVWFGDHEHSGDFVLSLGGYHPLFQRPEWYPALPRLGFDWNVSDTIHLTGGVYFALTPSCVMAGGALALTYHDGDLQAWFTAHVDVIVFWKPFYVVAGIGVSVGASYRMSLGSLHRTFTVELGVDVELWGPPVAGTARIEWWVISFTVDINGGGQPSPPGSTLGSWDEFADAFLPPASPSSASSVRGERVPVGGRAAPPETSRPVCRARASRGLLRMLEHDTVWVVSASDLVVDTESVVPCTEVLVGPEDDPDHRFEGPPVGVYPMGSVELSATHLVRLDRVLPTGPVPVSLASWTWQPSVGNLPQSLWGRQNSGAAELGAATVPVVGGSTGAPGPVTLTGPGPISFAVLRYAELPDRTLPLPSTPPVDGAVDPTADPFAVLEATVTEPTVVSEREAVVAVLRARGVAPDLVGGDLSGLADEARVTFAAPPMVGPLGSTGPRPPAPRDAVAVPASGRGRPRTEVRSGPASPTGGAPEPPRLHAVFQRSAPSSTRRPGPARVRTVGAPTSPPPRRRAAPPVQREDARTPLRVAPDQTVTWRCTPQAGRVLELRGPLRRVLALDDVQQLVLDVVADGPVELPPTTCLVVVDEVSPATGRPGVDGSEVGWSEHSRLRQVSSQVLLGDGVLLRTQAPLALTAPGRGRSRGGAVAGRVVVSAPHLAANRVGDDLRRDGSGTVRGWVDTVVPAGTRSVLLHLDRAGDRVTTGTPSVLLASGTRAGVGSRWSEAVAVAHADTPNGTRVLLDLPEPEGPTHVCPSPGSGWRLRALTGSARPARERLDDLLGDGRGRARDASTALPDRGGARRGAWRLADDPTLVVWR